MLQLLFWIEMPLFLGQWMIIVSTFSVLEVPNSFPPVTLPSRAILLSRLNCQYPYTKRFALQQMQLPRVLIQLTRSFVQR
jgi:hypothetical protein